MSLNKFAVAILREAADTIEARAQQYQGVGSMFEDVARLAEVNPRTAFDVFIAMKQVRLAHNPEHHDSLVDLVAYFALKSCYGKLGAAGNECEATRPDDAEAMAHRFCERVRTASKLEQHRRMTEGTEDNS